MSWAGLLIFLQIGASAALVFVTAFAAMIRPGVRTMMTRVAGIIVFLSGLLLYGLLIVNGSIHFASWATVNLVIFVYSAIQLASHHLGSRGQETAR